ncbi:MAG: YccF domain-containing protein [Desulfovibrionaceae bacterium]
MSFLGNVIWIVFGGLWMAIGWLLAGVLMAVTIVGIPWSRSCFTLAQYSLAPFGKTVIPRSDLTGKEDLGTGTLGLVGNVVWFVLAGIWLAIGHVLAAILTACTIIGIPLAWQHLKLALLSLAPVGMTVVTIREAQLIEERNGRMV